MCGHHGELSWGMDTADREGFPDTVAASQKKHFKQPLIQEYKLNRATVKTERRAFSLILAQWFMLRKTHKYTHNKIPKESIIIVARRHHSLSLKFFFLHCFKASDLIVL